MSGVNDYRPPCPVIFFERGTEGQKQIFTIHCERLEVDVECYVSTAIINLHGQWTNRTNETLECVFALPTPGIIMNVGLNIGKDKMLGTAVISKQEAEKIISEQNKKKDIVPEEQSPYEQYVPDLFRLPFGNVKPNELIDINCQYLETLSFHKKGYVLSIPLFFPTGTIVDHSPWDKIVSVKCKINALSPTTTVESNSHHLDIKQEQDFITCQIIGTKSINKNDIKNDNNNNNNNGYDHPMYSSDEPLNKTGRDLEISYSVHSEQVLAHCIQNIDDSNPNKASLCLFVTPPASLNTTFGRAFFFLLDRSGSMVGEPYGEALRALHRAIEKLRPADQFNICAFDHRQIYFNDSLVNATNEQKSDAQKWIQQYTPERGGTIMDKPIEYALNQLENTDLLPFLVVITDGAVANEREICSKVEKRLENKSLRSRIITLGIGSYCNWYYLKMLSKIGRGFSDVVVYKEHIYSKIDHLIRMAATPVLTDIEIGLTKVDDLELYPYPIPDLFIHAPIVVAARYNASNGLPSTITMKAIDPHGVNKEFSTKIINTPHLPVDKIFVKQQIDLLTAQAWFKKSEKIEKQVIELSVQHSVPSAHTSLVLYEIDPQRLEEQKHDDDDEKQRLNNKSKKKFQLKNNQKAVAAIAVGGTVAVVAAGIMAFGDIQNTLDNIPVIGGGFDFGGDACCGGCDNCDCQDGCNGCDGCDGCGDCTIQ